MWRDSLERFTGSSECFFEHGSELLGFITGGLFYFLLSWWSVHLVASGRESACANELESYAGNCPGAGRVTYAGHVLSEEPHKDITWSTGLGVGRGITVLTS